MKKTITFLAAVLIMTSAAMAQKNSNRQQDNNYGNDNPHDVAINDNHSRGGSYDDRGRGSRYFNEREKDMQIERINREYFYKIQSVKNKFFMGRYQKERMITSLQFQRDNEIRSVMERFYHSGNQYGHRDNRYDDHDGRNWK